MALNHRPSLCYLFVRLELLRRDQQVDRLQLREYHQVLSQQEAILILRYQHATESYEDQTTQYRQLWSGSNGREKQ